MSILLVCFSFYQNKKLDVLMEINQIEIQKDEYAEGAYLFIDDLSDVTGIKDSNILNKLNRTYTKLGLNKNTATSIKYHLIALNLLKENRFKNYILQNKEEVAQLILQEKPTDALIYYMLAYESLEKNDKDNFEKYFLLGISASSFSDFTNENKKIIHGYFLSTPKLQSLNPIVYTANSFSSLETNLVVILIEKFKGMNIFKENRQAFFNQVYHNRCSIMMGIILKKYFNDIDINELKEKLELIKREGHIEYLEKINNNMPDEFYKNIIEIGELNSAVLILNKVSLEKNKN